MFYTFGLFWTFIVSPGGIQVLHPVVMVDIVGADNVPYIWGMDSYICALSALVLMPFAARYIELVPEVGMNLEDIYVPEIRVLEN